MGAGGAGAGAGAGARGAGAGGAGAGGQGGLLTTHRSHCSKTYFPQAPHNSSLIRKLHIKPEGVIWAKAKTCSFLHERCNYSHVTSSNWTQPGFLTDADFISYPSMCSDLDKSPCVQNDRTKSTRRAPVPWMGAF